MKIMFTFECSVLILHFPLATTETNCKLAAAAYL